MFLNTRAKQSSRLARYINQINIWLVDPSLSEERRENLEQLKRAATVQMQALSSELR